MVKPSAIIVVGASEGGVEALSVLAAGLPSEFGAAVFVVLHIGAHSSQLPALLSERGPLPACHPKTGDAIRAGHIYVAPPDHHMVLDAGRIRLTRGPRENWARPAIDPLFRSAAAVHGSDVIGVILTGGLNDGAAGLYEVARHGGVTVVQDPRGAINPSMPRSALKHVDVDHCLPLAEIPAVLAMLVAGRQAAAARDQMQPTPARREEMTAEYKLDQPVAVTCPDCGGALRRTETGTIVQFACHIGHVYTAEVMVAAQFKAMEWSLEAAMRALSERAELCRQMAQDARTADDPAAARQWEGAADQATERTSMLRRVLEEEWAHGGEPDSLKSSA